MVSWLVADRLNWPKAAFLQYKVTLFEMIMTTINKTIIKNNYSPQAQWILLNNPLDFVSGIIRQYSLRLRRIIVKYKLERYVMLKNITKESSREKSRNCKLYRFFKQNNVWLLVQSSCNLHFKSSCFFVWKKVLKSDSLPRPEEPELNWHILHNVKVHTSAASN